MTRYGRPFLFCVFLAALLAGGCKKSDDKALAQGEWAVVAAELPGEERRDPDMLKGLAVVVRGNRVSISHAKEKGAMEVSFALDQTKAPREIDFSDITIIEGEREEARPQTVRGIYKFEGDELVIALPLGSDKELPRPIEFKALEDKEKRRGVLVLHLKKK